MTGFKMAADKKIKFKNCIILKKNEEPIYILPYLKCIRLVSERSSHLPFKMHYVGFRAFKSPLY